MKPTPADYATNLTTREQLLLRAIAEDFPAARCFTRYPDTSIVLDMRNWGLLATYDGEAEGSVHATITPLGKEVCEMRRKMDEEKRR